MWHGSIMQKYITNLDMALSCSALNLKNLLIKLLTAALLWMELSATLVFTYPGPCNAFSVRTGDTVQRSVPGRQNVVNAPELIIHQSTNVPTMGIAHQVPNAKQTTVNAPIAAAII
jgi:hypothetical protein